MMQKYKVFVNYKKKFKKIDGNFGKALLMFPLHGRKVPSDIIFFHDFLPFCH